MRRCRGGGAGRDVLPGVAGDGAFGGDGPLLRDGSAAMVPVLWAIGVAWDRATRVEAREFARWLQLAGKPARPHWRHGERPDAAAGSSGRAYSMSVRAHSETVLRGSLRLPLPGGQRPAAEPVPSGSVAARRAGACTPQSDGAAPQRADRPLPTRGCLGPDSAQHPRRRVQRHLRAAALAPGPGAGRVLRLNRRAGSGVVVGDQRRCRPGPAVDHRGP